MDRGLLFAVTFCAMGLLSNIVACILLLLPASGLWAKQPATTDSIVLDEFATRPIPSDLIYCPVDLPSPSIPVLNAVDETALDEEDSDGEEDSQDLRYSADLSRTCFSAPSFVTELGVLPFSQHSRSHQPLALPSLRC